MTAAKHTPGPWRVSSSPYGAVVCDTPIGGHGHDDVKHYGGHLIAESIHRDADMALIAAAPQLLEALERATEWLGVAASYVRAEGNAPLTAEQCSAAIIYARAAIAAARGES